MNPFEFVIVIVIAVLVFRAWQMKNGYHRVGRVEKAETGEEPRRSTREIELQHEVEELRERVKVLERIATDDRGSRLLSDEIEKLRDR